MIELDEISKTFITPMQRIDILKKITLTVSEGQFIALTAPSGSGKTTLLNIIAGLLKPDEGRVLINDIDITKLNEEEVSTLRADLIGFVFQNYNLISSFTALENILFPMEIINEKIDYDKAEKLLELVNLTDRAYHFPHQLSGGEQQRLAFARALANDPPIMLIDEPTGNLDKKNSIMIHDLIKKLKEQKKTIIVATHDLEIIKLADKKYSIVEGRLVE